MSKIYKVCSLDTHNDIKNMLVFGEYSDKDEDLNKLYNRDPTNSIFSNIFSSKDLEIIKINKIIPQFINEYLFLDDTIETIKKKVLQYLPEHTYSGIYMFYETSITLTPEKVFELLTGNKKTYISQTDLFNFLINIEYENIHTVDIKEAYNFNDIVALNINKKNTIYKSLGQISTLKKYNYVVNPFDVYAENPFEMENYISTINQNVLLEENDICNNTIFICNVDDVLKFADKNEIEESDMIATYFPYLYSNGVINIDSYNERQREFIQETEDLLNPSWRENADNVSILNKVGNISTIDVLKTGISKLTFTIEPKREFNIPLDIVFKLIQTNKTIPFTRYSPQKNRENVYRLFCNKIARNGKKIPYLNKSKIFKLIRNAKYSKSVFVYLKSMYDKNQIDIYITFLQNGSIYVNVDFNNEIFNFKEINNIFSKINPIINVVNDYLKQNGYSLHTFNSITDDYITIDNINYKMEIPTKKEIKIKDITKCVSSVFNIISKNIQDTIKLRYKRVSNFNVMDSQEAFMIELIQDGYNEIEIINSLMENFKISSFELAREILSDFATSQQLKLDAFQNTKIKIKNNPGFLVTIEKEPLKKHAIVNIEKVTNILYLKAIQTYIKSIFMITQKAEDIDYNIKALCKGKYIEEIETKKDITVPVTKKTAITAAVFDDDKSSIGDDMLDVLFDSEEESDSEDELQSDSEIIQTGGSITGMKLTHPNPFAQRFQEREPNLFLKKEKQGFNSYARLCPSNIKRQPVILTQEEKDNIDKNHPGSYEHSISYQSSPDGETYHYICPRFWSFEENSSLTKEEVESGKYGDIIPNGAKVVGEGEGVYEFTSKEHIKNGKYHNMYPGFLESSKHPDGHCIPCCFKKWDSPKQRKLRKTCQVDFKERVKVDDSGGDVKEEKQLVKKEIDEYIKNPEKFPLEPNRIGYLPTIIQHFFKTDNKKCQVSKTNKNIKKNKPCLVRIGVENNEKQSFLAAIANIFSSENSDKILSINEFKQLLISSLDINLYKKLQNGNLIDIFYDGKSDLKNKIKNSYDNFIKYLNSETETIDYQYVWDLITNPNKYIFRTGINIVIIEIKEDDLTSDVELICPTNHYSKTFFHKNRNTAILIKKGIYYEPVVIYEDTGKKYIITKLFNLKKAKLENLSEVLEFIKNTTNKKCLPLPSIPDKYTFKNNINLDILLQHIESMSILIKKQVLNYNEKVVGVVCLYEKQQILIPCYPSNIISEFDSIYIDEYKPLSYSQTLSILNDIYSKSNKNILCKPAIKVIDDNLISGILTITNQFIPVSPEQDFYGDDLKVLNNLNYLLTDKISITESTIDEERKHQVNTIQLETDFYNLFRNTLRMVLGEYENLQKRIDIQSIVKNKDISYKNKLLRIQEILVNLTLDKVFIFKNYDVSNITKIKSCYKNKTCDSESFCEKRGEYCLLKIPLTNLITGKDNSVIYYGKISDELLRYNRINSFIFEPKMILSFSNINYNLTDNEILLLHYEIIQGYFDNLIPLIKTKYSKHTTFDTTNPLTSITYSNVLGKELEVIKVAKQDDIPEEKCNVSIKDITKQWKKLFPKNSKELVFDNTPTKCTFKIIKSILDGYTEHIGLSVNKIKYILIKEYIKLIKKKGDYIFNVMNLYGITETVKKLKKKQTSIEDVILSESYFMTNLDLWLLSIYFDLPIILYSGTELKENNKPVLVLNGNKDTNKFLFIKTPAFRTGLIPKYRLVVNETNAYITYDDLDKEMHDYIKESILNDSIYNINVKIKIKVKAKSESDSKSSPNPNTIKKPESTPQAESITQAESIPKAETIPQAESSSPTDSISQTESIPKAESIPQAESSPQTEFIPKAESIPDSKPNIPKLIVGNIVKKTKRKLKIKVTNIIKRPKRKLKVKVRTKP